MAGVVAAGVVAAGAAARWGASACLRSRWPLHHYGVRTQPVAACPHSTLAAVAVGGSSSAAVPPSPLVGVATAAAAAAAAAAATAAATATVGAAPSGSVRHPALLQLTRIAADVGSGEGGDAAASRLREALVAAAREVFEWSSAVEAADGVGALGALLLHAAALPRDVRLPLFDAATEVLLPAIAVGGDAIALHQLLPLLTACVVGDVALPSVTDALLGVPAVRDLGTAAGEAASLRDLGVVAAAYCRSHAAAATLLPRIAGAVQRHAADAPATDAPATSSPEALAAAVCALAASPCRVLPLMRAAAPALAGHLTAAAADLAAAGAARGVRVHTNPGALAPTLLLNRVLTVGEAYDRQAVVAPDVVAAQAAALAAATGALASAVAATPYLPRATTTHLAWLLSAAAYTVALAGGLPRHPAAIEAAAALAASLLHRHPDGCRTAQPATITRLHRLVLACSGSGGALARLPASALADLAAAYTSATPTVVSTAQRDVYKRLVRAAHDGGWGTTPLLETRSPAGLPLDILLPPLTSARRGGGERHAPVAPVLPAESGSEAQPDGVIRRALAATTCGIVVEVDGPQHAAWARDRPALPPPIVAVGDALPAASRSAAAADEYAATLFGCAAPATSRHPRLRQGQDAGQLAALPDGTAVAHSTLFYRWLLQRAGYTLVTVSHTEYAAAIRGKSTHGAAAFLRAKLVAAIPLADATLPA